MFKKLINGIKPQSKRMDPLSQQAAGNLAYTCLRRGLIIIFLISCFLSPVRAAEMPEMELMSQEQQAIQKLEASFLFCVDASCATEKKTFAQGDSVFIKVKASSVMPFRLEVFRDSERQESYFSLPIFYNFSESGQYKFVFYSRLDNYQSIVSERAFLIKEVQITKLKICLLDGVCRDGETYLSCPGDCVLNLEERKIGLFTILVIGLFIILVLGLLVLKSKKPHERQNF